MAKGGLDLGVSATVMHYVSEKPCEILDHVHMVDANAEERVKFAERTAEDWENIFLARPAEMKTGA